MSGIYPVGTLYAVQDLFSDLAERKISSVDFVSSFSRYGTSTAESVYNAAVELQWLCTADDGQLVPTPAGKAAHDGKDRSTQLRNQLFSIVETFKPTWAALLLRGRVEAMKHLDPEIQQCLDEAALLDEATPDVVQWWDKLSGIVRVATQQASVEIGRFGEHLTLRFEEARTKKKPRWQAFETNFAGYDVLSTVSESDDSSLKIEVKASRRSFRDATLFITEHEWRTALANPNVYLFHFWLLNTENLLFILPFTDIEPHIPKNCGRGKWKSVEMRVGHLTAPHKAAAAYSLE